jgi:Zn-dependent protease with chaperone function
MALAARAGARVLGAYEWGLGEKTKKANAALAGLGTTRRILVSDTMLADYSDEEIEIVLAHELAHHVHGDIWKGIVFESALVMAGFFLAARALDASAGWLGLESFADPAGLPLLLLAAGAVSVGMVPAAHAVTELRRSADRFALELTRNLLRSSRRCAGWLRRTSPKTVPRVRFSGCSTAIPMWSGSPPPRRSSGKSSRPSSRTRGTLRLAQPLSSTAPSSSVRLLPSSNPRRRISNALAGRCPQVCELEDQRREEMREYRSPTFRITSTSSRTT